MNTFTNAGIRLTLIFGFLFIILGCAHPPPPLFFSCANFTEAYWSEFNFGSDSPTDVVSTVSRLWEIDKDKVSVAEGLGGNAFRGNALGIKILEDNVYVADWSRHTSNGLFRVNTAWFKDGVLQKIDAEWVFPLPRPSLSQVVDCLGDPDYYIVYYVIAPEAVSVNLDLLYPDRGIVVRYESPFTSFFMPEPQKEFHPYMRIRELAVVAPGTVEQVVRAVYSNGNVGGGYVHNACLSEPWPGSIEAMEIVPLEEFSHCQYRDAESQ